MLSRSIQNFDPKYKFCASEKSQFREKNAHSKLLRPALETFELDIFQTGEGLKSMDQAVPSKSATLRTLIHTKRRSLHQQLRLNAARNSALIKRCLLSEDEPRAGQALYRFADEKYGCVCVSFSRLSRTSCTPPWQVLDASFAF